METPEYALMFRVEDTHWWYGALHRLIRTSLDAHLSGWRNRPILDAGCGTGAVLDLLGNSSKHVGIDLSPEALAFCRRRGLTNVVQGNITTLPFADDSFDAVISSSVLYHRWVPDVHHALRELRRVLRPGGVLVINVAAYEFLRSAHDDAVHTARRFTRSELERLLVANRLRIRALTYWTTLLFPLAVLARTLGASGTGRDFESHAESGWKNRMLRSVMSLELALLRRLPMPFGVSLFAIAEKVNNEEPTA
jgi:SAM-dependent methyltransferase